MREGRSTPVVRHFVILLSSPRPCRQREKSASLDKSSSTRSLRIDPLRSMLLSGAGSFACDDARVGAGEVDRFVGVDPSHPIADDPSTLDDFEDLTLARKLSGFACVNDDRISGVCVHHNPPVEVTVPADSARDVSHAPRFSTSLCRALMLLGAQAGLFYRRRASVRAACPARRSLASSRRRAQEPSRSPVLTSSSITSSSIVRVARSQIPCDDTHNGQVGSARDPPRSRARSNATCAPAWMACADLARRS